MIRGWIYGCNRTFTCYLMGNSRSPEYADGLILAYVDDLEDQLGAAHGRRVILEAEVTDLCVVNICTDRAPALIPKRLIEVY